MPALAKPTRGTARRQKATGKAVKATADRQVYEAVTARDNGRCRACGSYVGIGGHRHHIRGRAYTTVQDVCLVCEDCHRRLHVCIGGKTLRMHGDAEMRVSDRNRTPCGLIVEMLVRGHGWVTWTDR